MYFSKQLFKITWIIHMKAEYFDGSFVNANIQPSLETAALDELLGHKLIGRPMILLFKNFLVPFSN